MRKKIDRTFLEKHGRDYYERDDRERYADLIWKKEFAPNDVKTLLEWKSTRFDKDIKDRLTSPEIVKRINMLKKQPTDETKIDSFVKEFYPDYPYQAPIFGTFIKHLIKPDEFPIYDQYVHNAYHKLTDKPSNDDCLMECYSIYCDFFRKIKINLQCESKKLDEALWAYGKFDN